MRVVHLAYRFGLHNTGGAAIAATRLHMALLDRGVESVFLAVEKQGDADNVRRIPEGTNRKLYFACRRLLHLCSSAVMSLRSLKHVSSDVPLHLVPLWGLTRVLRVLSPDIVHIHWINQDALPFEQISRIRCPVVIHLHDLYMINATRAYPGADVRYLHGFTAANSSLYERVMFLRKKRMFAKKNPLVIGPSRWVKEMSNCSMIAKHCSVINIPYIIDNIFKFDPQLRYHHAEFVVLFGAYAGRRDPIKGWHDLELALKTLSLETRRNMVIYVFGEDADDYTVDDVPVHFLGPINSPQKLMEVYHSADVFAFPSIAETQGMVKDEALLCGLPVIAFDRTACAEEIEHGVTGWIARDGDVSGFAEGLQFYFEKYACGTLDHEHEGISRRAAGQFSRDIIVDKFIKAYAGHTLK